MPIVWGKHPMTQANADPGSTIQFANNLGTHRADLHAFCHGRSDDQWRHGNIVSGSGANPIFSTGNGNIILNSLTLQSGVGSLAMVSLRTA